MRTLNIAALGALVLTIIIFSLQNLATVSVAFLGWKVSIPMAFLIAGVYLLGMVSGWGVWTLLRRSVRAARGKSSGS